MANRPEWDRRSQTVTNANKNIVSRTNRRRWQGWRLRPQDVAWIALLLGLLFVDVARGQKVTWEYDPYKIRVLLAIDPQAVVSAQQSQQLCRALEIRAYVAGGATWRLTAELAPTDMRSDILIAPEFITAEQVNESLTNAFESDKIMLLGIRLSDGQYHVSCRELDCRTRTFGQMVRQSCEQRALLAGVAEDVVIATFTPIVRVEDSRGRDAAVRVRAGGLVYDDFCPSRIKVGDILRSVIRRNDRNGEPRPGGIQEVDWTYLLVRESKGFMLQCEVLSAMRNPLAGRHSSRVERVGLLVRPQGVSTVIQLVSRSDVPKPLEGYEIFAKKPLPKDSEEKNLAVRLGLTDWKGRVPVPADEFPLRLVYVKNGSHLIARLPVVVGYEPELVMELVSDDKRLEAEAFVKGMESTVMDLVARREILSARIQRRLNEGNLNGARDLVGDIKSFQTKDDLDALITRRQQAGLSSANEREQQRIDVMLSGTRILLNKYLSPDQLVALERMVEDAESGGGTPAKPPAEAETEAEKEKDSGDAAPE
jgi:hypothetical protein